MAHHYTDEKNALILISLMKAHNIRRIVVSPGSTNICFVASVQQDEYFELYSSVDERSAAYMACGIAAESKEPVAISCTGATASRNYMPGLTEAYYRHLPVLAITSTQSIERVGQNIPQVLDRSVQPNDIVNLSVYLPPVKDSETEWSCVVKANKALLELRRNSGGPVHIDLATEYSPVFNVARLPEIRKIERYSYGDQLPDIKYKKIALFIGAHIEFSSELTNEIDKFCENYNVVVLCDHTSNYWGKYRILPNMLCAQQKYNASCRNIDLLIHIGEISGAYLIVYPSNVWRIHEDGELRDTFRKLKVIFEMSEFEFFAKYNKIAKHQAGTSYFVEWKTECDKVLEKLPDLPFSNAWLASKSAEMIPQYSAIHFGILNSLRTWNYFELTKGTLGYCNTGGFGIDGGMSSLIGASIINPEKLYYCVIGDLAFFYDLNSIGNRSVGKNLRIILVNNGKGNEFRNYGCWAAHLGESIDPYISAAGHFGNKSSQLVKHYAEDLGFRYYSAKTKEEYLKIAPIFFEAKIGNSPILLEVFTTTENESKAIESVSTVLKDATTSAKNLAKIVLGKEGTEKIKRLIRH